MRVCFITPYSPREISGVGNVVADLAMGLAKREHDFVILTKSSRDDGKEVPGLREIEYANVRYIGGLLLILKTMLWILRERKTIDILHLHSISWLTAISAFLGRTVGIPRLLTIHGKFPIPSSRISSFAFKLKERLAIAMSSEMTSVSLEAKMPHHLDSTVLIRNGVDTSRFRPSDEERMRKREHLDLGESFALLFVGRLDAQKGVYELIEVVSRLARKDIDLRLILVGSGEDEKVRRTIDRNRLEHQSIWVGKAEDVLPFYQCSDLFVLFSYLEGIPLTVLEAMACELPCVATSVGGIPEVITNEVNGFLVEPGDKDALENRILWCLKNRASLQGVSRNARSVIERSFDRERMIEDYLEVYESLAIG